MNQKWQDIFCPEPTAEQRKAYQSDTAAKTKKDKTRGSKNEL